MGRRSTSLLGSDAVAVHLSFTKNRQVRELFDRSANGQVLVHPPTAYQFHQWVSGWFDEWDYLWSDQA